MGLLGHIKVVDFGQYVAGPLAGMLLADQGAEVVKIDPPGGRCWQNIAGDILDRGKSVIRLDLKRQTDLDRAREIIAGADILIENFRPGVMARLGLGPEQCKAINPGLIYLSLPGFASTDEELRGVAAWEGVIASLMGQFRDMGLNRILMGVDPSYSPLTLASAYGGVLGAASAMVALAARAGGAAIEVPLASALLEGLVFNSMRLETMPRRYLGNREREILRRREASELLDLSYAALQRLLDPFYRSYVCRDGRPYYLVACGHAEHPERVLRLLGLWDAFMSQGLPVGDAYRPSSEWPDGQDCILSSYPMSQDWSDRISEKLAAVFMTRTAFEWERLFGGAGIPGAAHRTTEEWLRSEHPLQAGLLVDRPHPLHGTLRQPGPAVWFEGDGRSAVARPGPRRKASSPDAWLAGLKVLDLTNVIAGPIIGQMLGRFGAEVVKIDPVVPRFDPWTTIGFGIAANRGKKSVLLDLKTEEGQDVLDRLLAEADVVLVNAVQSQAERLRLTEARISAVNPDAILCRIDAFGGPASGPNSEFYGYDDAVQAATGIMSRFGGSIETPEEHAHVGTIDVLCGFAGTFACAIALHARSLGRRPGTARTSLAAVGQLIQLPFMLDFPGKTHGLEPAGRSARGEYALYRAYRCADRWMFVAGPEAALPKVMEAIGATGAGAGELEEIFASRPLDYWRPKLAAADVEAVPMRGLADIRAEAIRRERPDDTARPATALFRAWPDHAAGPLQLLEHCGIRFSGRVHARSAPAPKYGQHTVEILGRLGLSGEEIDVLLDKAVAATGWSESYLPE